jgi:serine phosphatase RsbU (regulator of sigma subunit)/pSer/pThr/pTyr-binding forkhead associated (FHA) protein
MAILVTLRGPNPGKQFPLEGETASIGRHAESAVFLESQAVSRHHARVLCEGDQFFIEDLNSSNGTFLNGKRIQQRTPLVEQDTLQIGPYFLGLRQTPVPAQTEGELVIRESVNADPSSSSLHGHDPAHKLQVVLQIAQHLARTLDMEELLNKLADHLMQLFPQADRCMVLLCEDERLVVRAQQTRQPDNSGACPYSRTIVQKALGDAAGILSEDVRGDKRFTNSSTLTALDIRSLLCVPLIAPEGKRLGVLQLDRYRPGVTFQSEDLQLLTAVGLQVAVVLENAALHAEVLREERLRQELAMAREIQEGFLPTDFPRPREVGYELFGRVLPAHEVSGDFYDFFALRDKRLAFLVGDVSGKGMPAALFMVAVRTLGRHLAAAGDSPAAMLGRLNNALAADNPSNMFVTLVHGLYHPATGEVVLASSGHPLPLLRRADGRVETVAMESGRLLGYEGGDLGVTDARFTLGHGETLILYTDGCTDAHAAGAREMFGLARLQEVLGGPRTRLPLEACAEQAKAAVERFTGTAELMDDLTLFLLRRV